MIKPFFNRMRIFELSEKRKHQLFLFKKNFELARKDVDEMNVKYVNKKTNDDIEWLEGSVKLLHTAMRRMQAEIHLVDFDHSIRDLLNKRFEYYVQRDAIKGFLIITVGVSLEITSYLV